MNKYQAFSIIGLFQLIYMVSVILISAIFDNYWLLFLLLLAGCESGERRVLGLKEKKYNEY